MVGLPDRAGFLALGPPARNRATDFSVCLPTPNSEKETDMPLLWIIVLLLIIFAIGGGVAVNSFLWLLLIVAVVVALFALLGGRRGAL